MRKLWMAVVLGALALAPAQATGAETVGETFVPSVSCAPSATSIQAQSPGGQYQVSADGVITSWSIHASAIPIPVRLKVARHISGDTFEIRGESEFETPNPSTLNTFRDVRIPARAGDLIGMSFGDGGPACGRHMPGYEVHHAPTDLPVGTTTGFTFGGIYGQLSISAQVEPDADGDGFGDETQDDCSTDASTQGPCPQSPAAPGPSSADTDPPQVTITKGAPGVLKERKVTFRFKANETGSTFECALKGKAARKKLRRFKPCTSPKRYKRLRNGKHTFKVRATDPAGNTGKPATDKFTVAAKQKRRR